MLPLYVLYLSDRSVSIFLKFIMFYINTLYITQLSIELWVDNVFVGLG